MANLQKIVKVTQAQYDTLASGGTVGSYTGLDDNYVYLIEDTNEYITSNGGAVDGGNIDFYNGSGIAVLDNHQDDNVIAGFCVDYFASEIIFNSSSYYRPLFANDNSNIIYSEDNDYNESITINTGFLRVADYTDSGNSIDINARSGNITYYNDTDGVDYIYTLPTQSGTLALESYVQANPQTTTATLSSITIGNTSYSIDAGSNIVLNNTVGSESISDGTITLNVATRDTAQTFTGKKTIKDTSLDFSYTGASGNAIWHLEQNQYQELIVSRTYNGNKVTMWHFNGRSFIPDSTDTGYLGAYNKIINTAYVNTLNDGTNSITVAEIVAKQDAVQVKRYI